MKPSLRIAHRLILLWLGASSFNASALPARLILLLDAISYRDVQALQSGIEETTSSGKVKLRQAFNLGYFPASRLISTYPSTSDVSWTEMFRDPPLPGYQRTYFDQAENRVIFINGVTSSVEYELRASWRQRSSYHYAMSFVRPVKEFRREVGQMVEDFLGREESGGEYVALILSTDSAQHMGADIGSMLCALDQQLQQLRETYREREGRELQILIVSDHGNNHAGRGRRVAIRPFLKRAGYRVRKSIESPQDVVLPTAGIESWVEVHNAPEETERLVELLSGLEGADIVSGRLPGDGNRFLVMNSRGERAVIDWDAANNAYRYTATTGDPLQHLPAQNALRRRGRLDENGFAPAEAWMAETLTCHYPAALERIARGHTRAVQNPATVLISLDNHYVHANWPVMTASRLRKSGGTHGALDDLNSTGVVLSSFAPTLDTTVHRVSAACVGFPELRRCLPPKDDGSPKPGKAP